MKYDVCQYVPARSEGSHTSVGELRAELIVRAEVLVDEGGKLAGRLSTAVGLHAVPVELVVEALGGVVEESLVLACLNQVLVRDRWINGVRICASRAGQRRPLEGTCKRNI